MAYQDEEKSFIDSYCYAVKNGLLDPVVHEIEKPKAERKYNENIKKLISLNPTEYFISEIPAIEKNEFIELSNLIAHDIFGDKNMDEFNDLVSFKLKTNGSNMIFDGISSDTMNLITGERIRNIEIPDFYHVSSIITLLHEYTHYHMQLRNDIIEKKQHLNEVPSIYVEKLATRKLKELLKLSDLEQKIQETRLEVIVWHYVTHPEEVIKFINMYKNIKNNQSFPEMVMKIEKECPWVMTNESQRMFNMYRKSIAASYGLGYLFSESLLNKYEEDELTATKKLMEAVDRDITLTELLDYYKINATSNKTYETVNKTLDKVKNKTL